MTAPDLPVGAPVALDLPRPLPDRAPLTGRRVALVSADPEHASNLAVAYAQEDGRNWTYLPVEKPRDAADMRERLEAMAESRDPLFFTVLDPDGRAMGTLSYLRINPDMATIEIGWISFSPLMQRSAASTEAVFLLMRHALGDLGYRRLEWKCDALNAPSRAAALRLGFTFEGVHRQAGVVKGRNRDTAWFSILDSEWPALEARLTAWLAPENFDADGRQVRRLRDCG